MSEPFVLRHLGRERRYALDGSDLVVVDGTTGTERRVGLGTIHGVRLARIGNLEICALMLERGREEVIATDERGSRADLSALVRALHAALASRSVPFVRGSWLIAGVLAASCAASFAAGLSLYLGVIEAPAFATRGIVVAVVSALLGPLGVWTSRPRALRTDADIEAVLPR